MEAQQVLAHGRLLVEMAQLQLTALIARQLELLVELVGLLVQERKYIEFLVRKAVVASALLL
jgi:hypothetical protein